MNFLARSYSMQGQYTEAEDLFNRTRQLRQRVLGPKHPDTLNTVSDLGVMYQRQGKFALAESFAAEALAGRREALGPQQLTTMDTAVDLAWPGCLKANTPKANHSPVKLSNSSARNSPTIGADSGLKASWAHPWLDKRNLPTRNRYSMVVIKEW